MSVSSFAFVIVSFLRGIFGPRSKVSINHCSFSCALQKRDTGLPNNLIHDFNIDIHSRSHTPSLHFLIHHRPPHRTHA